ncbi:IS256 family transposase [Bacillaceae bacterium W0354]
MKILTEELDLNKILGESVITLIQEKIELFLRQEIEAFLNDHTDSGSKNGYYSRSLQTKFGTIDKLKVPRDREGDFQTNLFQPYARRDSFLEESIIALYQTGTSTQNIAKFIEKLIGKSYSPATISNVTNVVLDDIYQWQKRPVDETFLALYLDGIHIKVRRDDVDTEAVYVVLGLRFDGSREVLGFYIGGRETSNGWKEILLDLKKRGLKFVDVGIFDGLSGLEESFKTVFPLAKVQRCVVHKMRNLLNKVRKKDQSEIAHDFKAIYNAENRSQAKIAFKQCKEKWENKYRREVNSWEEDLDVLLTFYDYPVPIRKYVYTTNIIERLNKEIRKRLKTMNSLPSIDAADKIIYLQLKEYNQKGHTRGSLPGFPGAQKDLEDIKNKLLQKDF